MLPWNEGAAESQGLGCRLSGDSYGGPGCRVASSPSAAQPSTQAVYRAIVVVVWLGGADLSPYGACD